MLSTSFRPAGDTGSAEDRLLSKFKATRAQSVNLTAHLSTEDLAAQSMPDASPAKWHLAHTTWFFETFVLASQPGYAVFDEQFNFLFNSYYEAIGARQPRPQRGLLTRPAVEAVLAYRTHVDQAMEAVLAAGAISAELQNVIVLGLAHEQQHQELILTDLLHLFSYNPIRPAYGETQSNLHLADDRSQDLRFIDFEGGLTTLGRDPVLDSADFAFDNEMPRHQVYLQPYSLADRLVTNAEWLSFMDDGGYLRPEFWLAEGWALVQQEGWSTPLYWSQGAKDGQTSFTLAGERALDLQAPVTHVSYYEADAYARWRGMRLPTEAEWEDAVGSSPVEGNFAESAALRPLASTKFSGKLRQVYGDCWEWTASPYMPYPGFKPGEGAVGEYNGKFMINQMVLRGGSCVTPADHVRSTYRNFFHPHQRWQFSGVRLAQDVSQTKERPYRGL